MKPYLFEYSHGGKKWGLTLLAESEEDACARIFALQYARYLGEEVMRIPAGTGPLTRLICWIRNAIRQA